MRSFQRIKPVEVALVCACAITSSFGQTRTFSHVLPDTPSVIHVRMQPGSVGAVADPSSDAILQFPQGARTSQASYDADMASSNRIKTSASSSNNGNNDLRRGNAKSGGAVRGLITVPTFSKAFGGVFTDFPFTMMGNDPARGGRTVFPTSIVTVSLNLKNFDGNGGVLNVPFGPFENLVIRSPNFEESNYTSGGHIQFGDAVQRAEFFNSMGEDWHTELNPTIVDRVTIDIPDTVRVRLPDRSIVTVPGYLIEHARNGNQFILLLDLLFNNLIGTVVNNEINNEKYSTNAINMALFPNTSLFSIDDKGNFGDCCVGGFHTYFGDGSLPQSRFIFAFAGWDSPGIFRGGVADVTSMSHEISEALNDPFTDNIVPVWQFPGLAPGTCQGNLETGDPVEVLANSVFPVRIKEDGIDFVFHPQTEALLQWFEQGIPSDAIGGAFSYPDTTSLPKAADACPAPPTA
jgi:hypothetical protein